MKWASTAVGICALACLGTTPVFAGTWTQTTQADFAAGTVSNADVSAPEGVVAPASTRAGWWNAAWSYRLRVDLAAGSLARTDFPIELEFDFPALMSGAAIAGTFDPASVRIVEFNPSTNAVIGEKPSHYAHNATTGKGVLLTVMDGSTASGATRSYHVYFDVTEAGVKPTPAYATNTAATVLENAVLKIAGVNQNQNAKVAELSFKDLVIKGSTLDTVFVRFTKFGSSLGEYASPLTGYSGCAPGLSTCKLAANNYGATLSGPTLLVDTASLKINRVVVTAGAITITQFMLLTTGNGLRIYTRFENTGTAAAQSVFYWEGGDYDLLGASATDDFGVRNSDGSTLSYDTVSPGYAGIRATIADNGWDLQDRVKVLDAVTANAPGNQASTLKIDVGMAVRFPLPDIAAGDFGTLRLALAADPTQSAVQATLNELSTPVTETRLAVEGRCNAGSGTFLSQVFDSKSSTSDWQQLSWTQGLPPGAALAIDSRSGDSATPDSTWSAFSAAYSPPSGAAITHPTSRYFQFRVTLTPNASGGCPTLHSASATFDAPAVALAVTELSDPFASGASSSVRVTALEPLGEIARTYLGTVSFASTDPLATLPASYTFTSADGGTIVLSGVVLRTPGSQSVTATDTATVTITGAQTVVVRGRAQVAARWYDSGGTALAAENGTPLVSPSQQLYLRLGVKSVDAPWVLSGRVDPISGQTPPNVGTVTGAFSNLVAADTLEQSLVEAKTGAAAGWQALGDPALTGNPEHAWSFGTAVPTGGTGYSVCLRAKTTGEALNVGWSATTTPSAITFPAGWQITQTAYQLSCFDLGAAGYAGGALTIYVQDALRGKNADPTTDTFTFDHVYVRTLQPSYVALERSSSPSFSTATQVPTTELWDDGARANGDTITALLSATTAPQVHVEARPSVPTNQTDVAADGVAEWSFTVVAPGGGTEYYRLVLTDSAGTRIGGVHAYPTVASITIGGPPAAVAFGTIAQTVVAGACSGIVSVELRDANSNLATATVPTTVDLSSTSPTLAFFTDATCATATTGVGIPAGQSGANVYFKDLTAGAWEISGTVAGLTPANQLATILAADPAAIRFVSMAIPVVAGACSSALQLELTDLHGNAATAAANTAILVASTSGQAAFFLDASCTTPLVSAEVKAGSSGTSFHFRDTQAGTPSLTLSGAMLTPDMQQQTVLANVAVALSVAGYPSPADAGVAQPFTVTARDAYGNRATGYQAQVMFSATDAAATLPAPFTFTSTQAGEATFLATFATPGAHTLSVTDNGVPALVGSQAVQVIAGPAATLVVTGLVSPSAGGAAQTVTVEAKDAAGNRALAYAGTITFGSTDGAASLPGPYVFGPADQGQKTFTDGVTLQTSGTHSVTVTDTANAAISGSQVGLVVQGAQGTPCTGDGDCITGACADGVCCDGACTGECQACDVPGSVGTCGPAPNGTTCADATYCDGDEVCQSGLCQAGAAISCVDPAGEQVLTCDEATRGCVEAPDSPPVITEDAFGVTGVGQRYAYNAEGRIKAVGTPPLTFSACGGPHLVEPLTGEIWWTPTAAAAQVPLCVRVENAFGSDTYSFAVDVLPLTGAAPTAAITISPPAGPPGTSFELSGASSIADATTPIVAYRWDFGDFSRPAFGVATPHVYRLPGGYQAELVVVDLLGRTASAKAAVAALHAGGARPPTARARASATAGAESIQVDLRCDCAMGDAPLALIRWDLPEGPIEGESVSATFGPGRHRVRLTVVDEAGLRATDVVEVAVTSGGIEPPGCRVYLDPPAGEGPLSVTHFAALGDAEGPVASATLSFADGTTTAEVRAERSYATSARYPVGLSVTDAAGLTCLDAAEVVVLQGELILPRIVSVPNAAGACGVPWSYSNAGVPVVEGDGQVRWSLEADGEAPLPSKIAVDETTGQVTWTPSSADPTPARFLLVATTEAGVARQQIQVDVACGGPRVLGLGCGCGTSSAPWLFALVAVAWRLLLRRRLAHHQPIARISARRGR